MKKFEIVLIKGDGIGPEIADAVVQIFDAAEIPIKWIEKNAGLSVLEKHPTGIPQETFEAIRKYKVALKGPTTTPVGTGHKSVNVTLRKSLELYANVRPAKSLPGVRTRFDNVDLIIVRENIEDTYSGIEHIQTGDVAQCLKLITRPSSMPIAKYAFEMGKLYGRKKITAVHKANIHKLTDRSFLECFNEVAREYPDTKSDDLIVDNTCMQLVTNPERFDVLVLPNLFGDILSDLSAGLVGGLGVAPGGNIGDEAAIFESVHGSAPDIACQGVANPTALLLSALQMLQHIGFHKTKIRIEEALLQTLKDGIKTRDLGGKANTLEFTNAIIQRLPSADENEFINPKPLQIKSDLLQTHKEKVEDCHGVDVFIESYDGIPTVPEKVDHLQLKMISNRGTKVYPGTKPDIWLVDHYRCRYVAKDENGNYLRISDEEIFHLLPKPFLLDESHLMVFLLEEWFEDFHEFHITKSEDGEEKLKLWEYGKGDRFLSHKQSFEIYRQIAMILTLYYDIENYRMIFPWHHAAGDFIVRLSDETSIDVRLTTVRGYDPFMEASDENMTPSALALFYFLLYLSVQMRLDKLDGVGDIVLADEKYVDATLSGFFLGLESKKAFRDYFGSQEEFLTLLRSFNIDDLAITFNPIVAQYEKTKDYPVIERNLRNHIARLYLILRNYP